MLSDQGAHNFAEHGLKNDVSACGVWLQFFYNVNRTGTLHTFSGSHACKAYFLKATPAQLAEDGLECTCDCCMAI